ncbi:hypothetical protein [Noviherbaspirillum sedimenti]|uniref:Uncharacterized protein n=1 Tax=Noviherbaspirillum sedimenti TaxID=2320865 RepID=A0A3A3G4U6_9BURK|nr:hypothetical protein [Noviherbaspirillum sedimenti]RJG01522.1 hypothetical protein D3878_07930 [Noviherbaspirillum sedimenti]
MTQLQPFQDEATVLTLDQMTLENRLDRIEMYGSLQITRDKAGLALAQELKQLIDATIAALEGAELPEKIALKPLDKVANPFK